MNKTRVSMTSVAASFAAVFFFAGIPAAGTGSGTDAAFAKSAEKPQTLCPIMGGAVDSSMYTDYKGKRVYFCCAGCKGPFMKDPDAHIRKMEGEGVVLEKTPQP